MAKIFIILGLLIIIATFLIVNYWPKVEADKRNKLLKLVFFAIILLLIVIIALLKF